MQDTIKKMKEKYSAEQMIEAIRKNNGILALAAKNIGCSRSTVHRYVKDYATVKAAYDEANESNIDFVESKLMANINHGDTTAIIFFLKTKGKGRGYVERQEVRTVDKDGNDVPVVALPLGYLEALKD